MQLSIMTVAAAAADLAATLARVADARQPVLLVAGAGRVPVAVLLDFETYEALQAARSAAGADAQWGPTNGPALAAA
jgi:PHD/YefM family antitoxin component YafN of YafNO toxin-antitoxin module